MFPVSIYVSKYNPINFLHSYTMKIRKTLVGLTISVLSAISITQVLNIHKAEAEVVKDPKSEQAICSNLVTGTYLTTIKDANGNIVSRGLITLTNDGNFIVGDSNQGGVSGIFDPFTTSQGTWVCTGRKEITARFVNFNISNQGGTGIARADYHASFDPTTKTVQGTIVLHLFDLLGNPLDGDGRDGGTSSFTGQFITAK